jgi:small conductance mechanosensitive channel
MNQLITAAITNLPTLVFAYGLNLLTAAAILIGGWIVAAWSRRSSRRALERVKGLDETLKPLVANSVRYAILAVVIVGVLAQFGVQTASIIAVIGAAGLAVGLALQGTLSHVASGVVILFLRPFGIGDYIDADGIAGTVHEIGLFATELATFDGVYVMVPNGLLIARSIRNYSRLPLRRLDIVVGIAYADDIEKALAAAASVLYSDPRVLADPAPQVMVSDLAESSVNITLRCWIPREKYWDLYFDLRKAIKLRFDAEGLTIPFPQHEVHVKQAA